jgi:hypothetical protein
VHYERQDQKDQKDEEDNLSDARRSASDAPKPITAAISAMTRKVKTQPSRAVFLCVLVTGY